MFASEPGWTRMGNCLVWQPEVEEEEDRERTARMGDRTMERRRSSRSAKSLSRTDQKDDQYEDFSVPVYGAREFTQALSTSKEDGPLK